MTHDPSPRQGLESTSEYFLYDWNMGDIVSELRALRNSSLATRQRLSNPAKLPSRKSLTQIMDGLNAALFPNRLSSRELADESIDYFVGHTLDLALRELVEQIDREFRYVATDQSLRTASRATAIEITRQFAGGLPSIRAALETDIHAAFAADPAARSLDEVLACYPGVIAIMHYRVAHTLYTLGAQLVSRMISEIAHSLTGIDIHPAAGIGGSFFIDHGTGVVVGETATIGEGVCLHHAVTLGAGWQPLDARVPHPAGSRRHPRVEDGVIIYSGATLLGPITVGRGSIIGGNVWLTDSVPPGSRISQAEVRNEAYVEGSGI